MKFSFVSLKTKSGGIKTSADFNKFGAITFYANTINS